MLKIIKYSKKLIFFIYLDSLTPNQMTLEYEFRVPKC